MGRPAKPAALPVIPDAIPEELRALSQWVVWRYDWRQDPTKPERGQWAKVPYSPRTRTPAAVGKPESWARFDQAMALYTAGDWDGIGFVFTKADPFAGLDLDKVRHVETGVIEPWALQHVQAVGSYTEVSTSGRGLHVIVRATLPPGGRRRGQVELYDHARYFAITGHHVTGTPRTIEERTDEVAALHARIFAVASPVALPPTPAPAPASVDIDDEALLARARAARNGARFRALFDDGARGEDHSKADLELCAALAFWCGRDAARMDRLFRRSALMRPKWDTRHYSDGRTYGAATIAKAIAGCTDVYAPKSAARPAPPAAKPPVAPEHGEDASRVEVDVGRAGGPLAAGGEPAVEGTPTEADQRPTYWTMTALADAYILAARAPHHRLRLGYPELDAYLRGVAPGEVLAILARSGVGKTAFGLNLAERMTAPDALPCLLFSLEMPGVGVFERLASMTTGWRGEDVEERARHDNDRELMQKLVEVCERWGHMRMVDTACSLDRLDALVDGARPLWSSPLRLVVVDYAGLVTLKRSSSPYERASTVAIELKTLAKRHHVALMVLYQLSRAGGVGGEEVTLSMARDSGVIEEAADFVLGCWRPELADDLDEEERAAVAGQFKVRVLKNRNRRIPLKPATLRFDGESMRITSPTEEGPGRPGHRG